ncbi:transient receptor potential cation channel subfamily a member 1 [Nannochloropsis oceanica]
MKKITYFASPRTDSIGGDSAKKQRKPSFSLAPTSGTTPRGDESLNLTADVREVLYDGGNSHSNHNINSSISPRSINSPRKLPPALTSIASPPSPPSPKEKRGKIDFSLLSSLSPGRKKSSTSCCSRSSSNSSPTITLKAATSSAPAGAGNLTDQMPSSPVSFLPTFNSITHPSSSFVPAGGTPPNTARSPRTHSNTAATILSSPSSSSSSTRSPHRQRAEGLRGLLGYSSPSPPSDSPIHLAARQGDISLLQTLLASNPSLAAALGHASVTPLMLAAGAGEEETVKFLLDLGREGEKSGRVLVDVLKSDAGKKTALHHAAMGNLDSPGVALLLLGKQQQHQQLLEAVDVEGRTALHYAAVNGHLKMLRVLLSGEKGGVSPLSLVMDNEGLDPLQFLLSKVGGEGGKMSAAHRTEVVRTLQDAQERAKRKSNSNSSGDGNEMEGRSPGWGGATTCVWDCVARLCGEAVADAEDEEEEEIVQPIEHQLLRIFRAADISQEASDVYLDNLRRHGYDNLISLHAIAADRFKMTLGKYVPDRQDRKRILKALHDDDGNGSGHICSNLKHLPVGEYLKHLLSVPDEMAGRYAEGLGGMNVHTGAQLCQASYDEVELNLAGILLQGHKKALKILLKTSAAASPLA